MRSLTLEQARTWRRVCDPYPVETLKRTIRKLAEVSKYTPQPADLRKLLLENKGSEPGRHAAKPKASKADLDRQFVEFAFPSRKNDIAMLTDRQAESLRASVSHWSCVQVYGQHHASTKAAQVEADKLLDDLPEGWL